MHGTHTHGRALVLCRYASDGDGDAAHRTDVVVAVAVRRPSLWHHTHVGGSRWLVIAGAEPTQTHAAVDGMAAVGWMGGGGATKSVAEIVAVPAMYRSNAQQQQEQQRRRRRI